MATECKQLTSAEDQSTALITMIERVALNENVDIDKMERLLAMQTQVFEKQAEVAFNQAMADVQAEGVKIKRNQRNEQTKSAYANLEAISDKLKPVITDHGFSLSFGTDRSPIEEMLRITCLISHKAGHSRSVFVDLPIDMAGMAGKTNKTRMHGIGSTMSYGRRYLTLLIFDVAVTNEDDDGLRGGGNFERDQILQACEDNADSLEVIRQCIDDFQNDLGDLIKAFEAWNEISDADKGVLWVSPSKCREMGIEPVFTTKQIQAFKVNEWGEARRAVLGTES